jgi:hypothetical protein
MADKSFTLFEVHLHDGLSFSATNTSPAIGVGDDESEETEIDVEGSEAAVETGTDAESSGAESSGAESSGAGNGLKVLIGLVLVAGLAVAARKLMGESDLEELEELDDLAAEA